jgi:parallel beta-helix repeat protein
MKKQSKQSKVSKFLFVSILIIGISTFSSMRVNATNVSYDPPSYSSLTPHDPISITSDDNFTDYSFLGTGTDEDPYVIEGYNISTTSTRGIYITDTTKYFTVRNCYVDAGEYGIYIRNVASGTATVINNTCTNNNNIGIYLYNSGSSTVVNNTCSSNNFCGIFLSSSVSSTVANNTCNSNEEGIYLSNSGSSIVANNTCNNNEWDGIYLESSGSSTVTNNTCNNNNWGGILFELSGSSTVANNSFTNCGLYIYEETSDAYLSYTVENNWVNGKILGFYTNLDSMIIAEPVYGQLILVNCTTVTVRDQILNNTTIGLFLRFCTSSVIINNTCNNGDYGIYLSSSGSSTVANNTCNDNRDIGILLSSSGSSTVANNTCDTNFNGISLQFSGSSTVANNTFNNNNIGFFLFDSDFCNITYNLLQENVEYGIWIYSNCDNNIIHQNNFVDNYLGGTSQASDAGTNNYWYDTTTLKGNYWSDWSGIGPYSIDGAAGARDLYPLDELVDFDSPQIVNIILSPSTPTDLDTVSINATVTDTSGVQSVTLHYRVNGGNWIEASMTLISGDFYSVTLGPFAVSETIEYYVSAVDNSVNHNEAINDNAGLYYSFTVAEVIPEFQTLSPLLSLTIIFLFLGCSLVLLKRRKR